MSKEKETDYIAIIESYFPLIVLIGVVIAGVFLYYTFDIPAIIDQVKKDNIANSEASKRKYDVSRFSEDCNELKELRLYLVTYANADSWFPLRDDRTLRIANERYDILCTGD